MICSILRVGVGQVISLVRETNHTIAIAIYLLLTVGLLCIYKGRGPVDETETHIEWSSTFWLGEILILWSVILCYWDKTPRVHIFILFTITPFLTLWTRGGFWKYVSLMILTFIHNFDIPYLITFIAEVAGARLADGPLSSIVYQVAKTKLLIGCITCVASKYTPMVRNLTHDSTTFMSVFI